MVVKRKLPVEGPLVPLGGDTLPDCRLGIGLIFRGDGIEPRPTDPKDADIAAWPKTRLLFFVSWAFPGGLDLSRLE